MLKKNIIIGLFVFYLCILQIFEFLQIKKLQESIRVISQIENELKIKKYIGRKALRLSLNATGDNYSPITIQEDNPEIPYDDYSSSEQDFTNYNSEKEDGIAGQNPPVYSEMSNIIGIN